MDYFTKNKILFWCVVALAILNIATLASFWMGRPGARNHQLPDGGGDGQKIMQEKLSLSDEQAQQFERIRNEHFKRTRPLQDDMHKMRLDLLNEIFATKPDETRIQNLLIKLENKQIQFEKNLFKHFEELKEACNEQQVEELGIMLKNLIERTRPQDPRHRPHRPPGRFAPGHIPPH